MRPVVSLWRAGHRLPSDPVAAALARRKYLGIELEQHYCDHAVKRLAGVARYASSHRGRSMTSNEIITDA